MFEHLGISQNSLPKTRRRGESPLLIVGGARCVWDDHSKINARNYDIMCINDIVMHYPSHVDYLYSNDHKMLENWVNARRPRYKKDFGEQIKLHTCQVGYGKMCIWPWPGTGSSGLNAVYTGLALGYEEILIAGVPLSDEGHYFDSPLIKTNFTREVPDCNRDGKTVLRYWYNSRHIFKNVRSLSGRTKELLNK